MPYPIPLPHYTPAASGYVARLMQPLHEDAVYPHEGDELPGARAHSSPCYRVPAEFQAGVVDSRPQPVQL